MIRPDDLDGAEKAGDSPAKDQKSPSPWDQAIEKITDKLIRIEENTKIIPDINKRLQGVEKDLHAIETAKDNTRYLIDTSIKIAGIIIGGIVAIFAALKYFSP